MSVTTGSRPMRILEHGVYRGPHLYSHRPMVRIQVDLGEMESWPTDRLPGFADALIAAMPTLDSHHCSLGERGGFLKRLHEGTWLGHVVEHVALEIQALAGAKTTRGKTRSVKGRPGVYNVMFAYDDEAAGLLAGRLAFQIVNALLPEERRGVERLETLTDGTADLSGITTVEAAVPLVKAARRRGMFGPSTQALVDAARRRGIPVTRLNGQSLVQLGWGARQRRLRASVTDRTGLVASELAGDKAEAKALLSAIGCPVARGVVVRTADRAIAEAKGLKRPLVVKPLDGNHGRGVTTGLRTEDEIRAAFELAVPHSRHVIVEEELPGRDHRILVVDGQVVAVAERVPAQVIGDGSRTITELVAEANADPRRGDGHENTLTRIRLDDQAARDILERQGMTVDSVPAAGQVVALRTTANLSSGGIAIDRTDQIHPDNAAIARRAALAVGLDVAGIDLLAPDITRSIRETGGGIVEVNAAPGLRMHLAPSEGQARDVAEPIIRMMFPRGARSRIPILAVTGTNGKSTVGRMLSQIFRHTGRTVGLTNTSGVYINDEQIAVGDSSGPKSARMVLRDPTVEVAVLECARGGILREGLAFDSCDVGAVLNVQPDHLGIKGIDTLEDLAAVKSVVVESVSRRGVSVLNADDPLTLRMAEHSGGRTCWFSMRGGRETPGFLLKHIGEGGLAVLHDPENGEITLHDAGAAHRVCNARDIPATLNGAAAFNVQNALAAAGMAYGAGVEPTTIGAALSGFASTFEQNPGRLNVHDGHGFRVILDYAHNPEGLRALGRLVSAIRPPAGRTIAMLSVPGDRRDAEMLAMGEIGAEFFDQLVFRETPDNRGRPAGDVIRLMSQGAEAAGCGPERIRGYHREEDAVAACLEMARPGDLVILTPTRVEAVWRQMLDFRPAASMDGGPAGAMLEPPHG
ncbi:cyanophycin synthetase [Brevundimonas alba]|uniref:Cyanophycin synthetase n=1 Tax=Brevundimonas alba TaxID=74314 RepID=A0A7X5YJB6_9CAUL|nr:cyanophycin synthetase [Brevundimonas alba]NJC41022.1 cyanophycin synthetase [Brevundimonas alba]